MERSQKQSRSLTYFFTFLTSFFLGFFCAFILFDGAKMMQSQKNSSQVLNNTQNGEDLDFSSFWQVYNLVKDEYYSFSTLQKEKLENGIIKGFVDALGDKHTEFMNQKEKAQFEDTLTGDFEGIGAVVEKHELGVKVERVLSGSPAKKYGVFAKDIIIKANGVELADLDLYDAVEKIRGEAGSKVVLTILREGETDMIDVEVTREKITVPSVESKIEEKDNIGVITLNMFGESTASEFRSTLAMMKEKNVDGIIIDLRDNGGGYLQSAVEILSEFVDGKQLLVETRFRNPEETTSYYSLNSGEVYDKKIVILVNENSASASEITAGALREYEKAIIVGQKTYGKGSVQEPFDLGNGGLLKMTIAHWYTPKGKSIEEEGISPDIEVKLEKEDYEKKYDRQLEEAKKVLKEFVKTGFLQLSIDNYLSTKK